MGLSRLRLAEPWSTSSWPAVAGAVQAQAVAAVVVVFFLVQLLSLHRLTP
jgi:hypothetical protein